MKTSWEFSVLCRKDLGEKLASLLTQSADPEKRGFPVHFDFGEEEASFEAEWREKPLLWPTNQRSYHRVTPTISSTIDHIAICIPATVRDQYLSYLSELFAPSMRATNLVSGIESSVEFCTVEADAVDVNVITPRDSIAHLTSFFSRHCIGGIFHLGVSVVDMVDAIALCASLGIPTLADRIAALSIAGQSLSTNYSKIVTQGYVEESDNSGGFLRQTFVFPFDLPGSPFVELVERRDFAGYGNRSAKILLSALDSIF